MVDVRHVLYDEELLRKGVIFGLKYLGNIEILCSMKGIGYRDRCRLTRLCIANVCEIVSGMIRDGSGEEFKKLVFDRKVSGECEIVKSPVDVLMTISADFIKVLEKDSRDVIAMHSMEAVSFASTGTSNYADFIAYVAKDSVRGRSCFVFESTSSRASLVMTTIGQAFNLKYKDAVSASRRRSSSSSLGTSMVSNSRKGSNGSRSLITEEFDTLDDENISDQATTSAFDHRKSKSHRENAAKHNITENLFYEEWYHGPISRIEAEDLLEKNGDFLVRKSTNISNQYVLSGKYNEKCRHLLLVDPDGKVRTKGISFPTISALINYHQRQRISIVSPDSKIVLVRPVIRIAHLR